MLSQSSHCISTWIYTKQLNDCRVSPPFSLSHFKNRAVWVDLCVWPASLLTSDLFTQALYPCFLLYAHK